MALVTIPFDDQELAVDIPLPARVDVHAPRRVEGYDDPSGIIGDALERPMGSTARERLRPGSRVAVLVEGLHRPTPTYQVLKVVLQRLAEAGVPDNNITIVVANGVHFPGPRDEWERKMGPAFARRYQVEQHTRWTKDLAFMGFSRFGTPLWINRVVAEADLKISMTVIAPNRFAGFSGGGKMILPGVAGFDTICHNHNLALADWPMSGKLDGNPMREEIKETARRVGLDLSVDVVLNPRGRIAAVFAGEPFTAHREGVRLCREIYDLPIQEDYDVGIIASRGPMLSLMTSITELGGAVREGGTIIITSPIAGGLTPGRGAMCFLGIRWCPELERCCEYASGLGSAPEDVLKKIASGDIPGWAGGGIYWTCKMIATRRVLFMGKLGEDELRRVGIEKIGSLEAGLSRAYEQHGRDCRIAVFPWGGMVTRTAAPAHPSAVCHAPVGRHRA